MLSSRYLLLPLLLVLISLACLLLTGRLDAQPGTENDPILSLSYLESALRVDPVILEGGEEFPISSGRGLALLEGRCMIIPPDSGRWWILDITKGEIHRNSMEMSIGHWYVPVSEDGRAGFALQALQASTVAVPAGSGTE